MFTNIYDDGAGPFGTLLDGPLHGYPSTYVTSTADVGVIFAGLLRGERDYSWQRHSEIPLEIAYTRQGNQVAFINELPEMKKAQPSGLFHVWMILHADVSLFFQDGIFFWGVA